MKKDVSQKLSANVYLEIDYEVCHVMEGRVGDGMALPWCGTSIKGMFYKISFRNADFYYLQKKGGLA